MPTESQRNTLEGNFEDLRRAVADRKYDEAQRLLAEQRRLIADLDLRTPEHRHTLEQAMDLANWALTLARVQHSHTERAFASLLKLKQLDQGYLPSPVCSAELVRVKA